MTTATNEKKYKPQWVRITKNNGQKWFPCTKNTPQDSTYFTPENQKRLSCFPNLSKNKGSAPPIQKGLFIPTGYPILTIDAHHNTTPIRSIDTGGRIQYQYGQEAKKKNRKMHWKHISSSWKKIYDTLNLNSAGYPASFLNKKPPQWNAKNKGYNENLLHFILALAIFCGFRPGNELYKKKHGSTGLITLEWGHVIQPNPNSLTFHFIGKKKVENICACVGNTPEQRHIREWWNSYKAFANKMGWVKENERVWHLENGTPMNIETIQDYIQKITNLKDITWKDIRTFMVNWWMMDYLYKMYEIEQPKTVKDVKKIWKQALEFTARHFHHTTTVCNSSYLHPSLKEWITIDRKEPLKDKKEWMNKIFS